MPISLTLVQRRTPRSTQRQDQRRSRELAAANLADITGQPVRLCMLSLDRENGNQDRAANWLFEHGETFLSEHPEYAESSDGGGGGQGGRAAGEEDTETTLFLLHDCYSYTNEAGEQDQATCPGGGDASGGLDLPQNVLEELRSANS